MSAGSSEVATTTTERARPALAEIVLQEFLHLAPALANEPDHRHVGGHVAGHHRQQHRFADAGARENAHALAAAAGREGIERPHPEIERSADPPALMRGRRRIAKRIGGRPERQRPLAIDRLAHGVDDAPEPGRGRPHRGGKRRDDGAAAAPHALERAERHQERVGARKSNHLAGDVAAGAGLDHDAGADRHGVDGPGGLDHQAAHRDDAAVDLDAVELVDLVGERFHAAFRSIRARRRLLTISLWRLTSCLPASLIIASPSVGLSGEPRADQDGGRES